MVVVLPAPLEPSSAKMLPGVTSKLTPRSTSRGPNDFVSPAIRIAGVVGMAPASRVDAGSRSSPVAHPGVGHDSVRSPAAPSVPAPLTQPLPYSRGLVAPGELPG